MLGHGCRCEKVFHSELADGDAGKVVDVDAVEREVDTIGVVVGGDDAPAGRRAAEEFAGVAAFAAGNVYGEVLAALRCVGFDSAERAEEGVARGLLSDGAEIGGPIALVVG